MYKYNVNIMPSSFDNVFSKLHYMHDHGTRRVSENFHHKRVWTYYGKKMLHYVGPVAWGRICSNSITLPLHMFSCRVKLRLLAGYWLLCEIFLWFVDFARNILFVVSFVFFHSMDELFNECPNHMTDFRTMKFSLD